MEKSDSSFFFMRMTNQTTFLVYGHLNKILWTGEIGLYHKWFEPF